MHTARTTEMHSNTGRHYSRVAERLNTPEWWVVLCTAHTRPDTAISPRGTPGAGKKRLAALLFKQDRSLPLYSPSVATLAESSNSSSCCVCVRRMTSSFCSFFPRLHFVKK